MIEERHGHFALMKNQEEDWKKDWKKLLNIFSKIDKKDFKTTPKNIQIP